jgi:hypothetical protein
VKAILIVIGVLIGGYLVLNQSVINSYDNQLLNNWERKESERMYLYVGEYKPVEPLARLQGGKLYKLPNAWAESRWRITHQALFWEKVIDLNGLNIILPDTGSFFEKDYSFEGQETLGGGGAKDGIGWKFATPFEPDTITFLVKCKREDSWQETIITDTVKYYRDFTPAQQH